MRAKRQNNVRPALGVLHDAAALQRVQGGHHLASGVKGRLAHAGHGGFQFVLFQRELCSPGDKRGFGRLTGDLAVFLQLRIGAQGHGGGDFALVAAGKVHNRHLVLRERAGFVRADDLRAAERFHGGEAPDDGVAAGHIRHADGKHHRHNGGKAFRDGGNGQRHRDHKRIENHIEVEITRTEQLHAEDDNADHNDEPREDNGELAELALQRRFALRGAGKRVSNLAHLGLHAGGCHEHGAAAVDNSGTHVGHVLAVAERDGSALAQIDDVNKLVDRHTLARQRGLLDLQRGAFNESSVRRNGVARLEQYDVAGDQLLAADDDELPVAHDAACGGGHLLQRFDGFLRLVLLINAEHRVNQHDGENDDGVCNALTLDDGEHGADGRRDQQDDNHGIHHLLEETLEKGILLRLGETVFAVFIETRLRLRAR